MINDPPLWIGPEAQLGARLIAVPPLRPLGWWEWFRFHVYRYLVSVRRLFRA